MATDAVCTMSVQPSESTQNYQHEDTTYWFCTRSCRNEFVQSPERILATITNV